MRSLISDVAIASVEIPMPIIMQIFSHQWLIRCWAQPQVVVDVWRNFRWLIEFADRITATMASSMNGQHFAVLPFLQIGKE